MADRVAIYYRVSTADQNHDGQVRELREYADRRGLQVVGEYVDTASGAKRSRPELDRMLKDVRSRKADIVLVWAFDRFARSTSHLVTTLEEFQALGVDFVSYRQLIDTTTPAGKLTFTVLAAIAEFERELIRERVKAGMAAAKAKGRRRRRRGGGEGEGAVHAEGRRGGRGQCRDGGELRAEAAVDLPPPGPPCSGCISRFPYPSRLSPEPKGLKWDADRGNG